MNLLPMAEYLAVLSGTNSSTNDTFFIPTNNNGGNNKNNNKENRIELVAPCQTKSQPIFLFVFFPQSFSSE